MPPLPSSLEFFLYLRLKLFVRWNRHHEGILLTLCRGRKELETYRQGKHTRGSGNHENSRPRDVMPHKESGPDEEQESENVKES